MIGFICAFGYVVAAVICFLVVMSEIRYDLANDDSLKVLDIAVISLAWPVFLLALILTLVSRVIDRILK